MAHRKWDLVWVYWIHHQNLKDFVEQECSVDWINILESFLQLEKVVNDNFENYNKSVNETTQLRTEKIKEFTISQQNVKNCLVEIQEKIMKSRSQIIYKSKIYSLLDNLLISLETYDSFYQQVYLVTSELTNNSIHKSNIDENVLQIIKTMFQDIRKIKEQTLGINVVKGQNSKYRPCLIFHKSDKDYWVLPLSTSKEGFNEKFDIWLDEKSYVQTGNFTKIYESYINKNFDKIKITDEQKKQIKNKLKWFFSL